MILHNILYFKTKLIKAINLYLYATGKLYDTIIYPSDRTNSYLNQIQTDPLVIHPGNIDFSLYPCKLKVPTAIISTINTVAIIQFRYYPPK